MSKGVLTFAVVAGLLCVCTVSTVLAQDPQALSTVIQFQNLDETSAALVQAIFYDEDGNEDASSVVEVGPSEGGYFDQRAMPELGSSWRGSVVLSSSRDIGAIVNEASASSSAVIGASFRADSYNSISDDDTATQASLPQILKNIYDPGTGKTWNTMFAVQNTSSSEATVYVTYTDYLGTQYDDSVDVPAFASHFFEQATDPVLPSSFFGSAVVTSTVPLAAVVNLLAPGSLTTYLGFPSGSAEVYLPQVIKNAYDPWSGLTWGSTVQVMSLGGTADVYISYPDGSSDVKTADPTYIFDQRNDPAIISPAINGPATVTSTVDLAVTVNLLTYGGSRSMTYRGFTGGTTKINVPFVIKNIYDPPSGITWGSTVQVMSLGGDAEVYITYYGGNGPVTDHKTAEPLAIFDQRNDPALAGYPNFFGTAVVTSTVPIVATVNEVGQAGGLGDAAANFIGVNVTPTP